MVLLLGPLQRKPAPKNSVSVPRSEQNENVLRQKNGSVRQTGPS